MKKRILLLISIMTLFFMISGCTSKVNDKESEMKAAADNFDLIVSNNLENKVFHNELKHFGLLLKDQDKFEWTEDPSFSDADFSLSINAKEFIDAGLDTSKLQGTSFSLIKATESENDLLVHKFDVSNNKEKYEDYKEAFEKLIGQSPNQLATLQNDGYILDIGQGFQVHWNGEKRENKDIAFIINADDLIKAGVKVELLNEWKLIENKDSTDEQVKLLKVYYLK